ncbi:hypothetical protein B0H10DRAFT_945854 [Mycena sp. CBHHK59/15]|nr:hypothetical protein B0H10DRAFT_945854 [Mycena sp. CBHHK59/15]
MSARNVELSITWGHPCTSSTSRKRASLCFPCSIPRALVSLCPRPCLNPCLTPTVVCFTLQPLFVSLLLLSMSGSLARRCLAPLAIHVSISCTSLSCPICPTPRPSLFHLTGRLSLTSPVTSGWTSGHQAPSAMHHRVPCVPVGLLPTLAVNGPHVFDLLHFRNCLSLVFLLCPVSPLCLAVCRSAPPSLRSFTLVLILRLCRSLHSSTFTVLESFFFSISVNRIVCLSLFDAPGRAHS